ncbi:MAG TPA: restriction endonuclease subunit S [Bacillota bacterium]|nr:restriction endonuclease subunit S [Bacillota bacterium]
MRWKRYPAYKDSGVEWLSEVPEHWDEYSLHWCVEEINTDVRTDSMIYIGLEHIDSWTGKVRFVDQVSEGISGKHFLPGDVLFGKLRPYLAKGFVADKYGLCSGELLVLRPHGMNRFYLHYLLLSPGFVGCVDSSTYGAKMPRASWEFIRKIVIPVPSLGEQECIASFIDAQTRGIDTLISKKQRQLELLEEKRITLITHAVTKGLDPDVKMKDSGVEWLGEVPEHWKVVSLKRMARISYGLGQPPRELEDGIPLIRATDVSRGTIDLSNCLRVDPTDVPAGRDAFLEPGDIIVVRSGAYTGDSAVVPRELAGAVAGYDMIVRCSDCLAEFMAYVLLSDSMAQQINMVSSRAAQAHLNAEQLGDCIGAFPPFEEQRSIARYLDRETTRMNVIRDKIQHSIELLQEYRSALISAAVTGQIDVREEVI